MWNSKRLRSPMTYRPASAGWRARWWRASLAAHWQDPSGRRARELRVSSPRSPAFRSIAQRRHRATPPGKHADKGDQGVRRLKSFGFMGDRSQPYHPQSPVLVTAMWDLLDQPVPASGARPRRERLGAGRQECLAGVPAPRRKGKSECARRLRSGTGTSRRGSPGWTDCQSVRRLPNCPTARQSRKLSAISFQRSAFRVGRRILIWPPPGDIRHRIFAARKETKT